MITSNWIAGACSIFEIEFLTGHSCGFADSFRASPVSAPFSWTCSCLCSGSGSGFSGAFSFRAAIWKWGYFLFERKNYNFKKYPVIESLPMQTRHCRQGNRVVSHRSCSDKVRPTQGDHSGLAVLKKYKMIVLKGKIRKLHLPGKWAFRCDA